jgi:hypothetical protein
MQAQAIALLILTPFIMAFAYAGVHEYRRYKSEGSKTYGLVYDENTGTTHVGGIADDEEAYDPETYDPNTYQVGETQGEAQDEPGEEKS